MDYLFRPPYSRIISPPLAVKHSILLFETDYSLGIARMNVFFLQRNGINLYYTLHASETSRNALWFYHPKERPGGVVIPIESLVSGLSIAGELRWYIRRYMQDVLFEFPGGNYCTLALSRQIYYDREIKPENDWPFRRLYIIRNGHLVSAEPVEQGVSVGDTSVYTPDITRFIVWCTEEEYLEPRKSSVQGEEGEDDDTDR
jgi:hypothetical protein